jgi:signal transduction histidine kinase
VSEKSNEATRKKYSALVYREIKRIDQVVNGFLNIGHDQSVSMESISLETVIQESSSLLTPMLKNKNVQFNVHISGHLEVIVEKRSFHQVIMNLVINASNAMHATGGKIKISTEFKDDQVRINIEDTGVGVPEEIKPRLFDAFATSRKEGSGLGLYLSRNIIRSFNGELELSSSTPGSTIFSIRLPGTLSDV